MYHDPGVKICGKLDLIFSVLHPAALTLTLTLTWLASRNGDALGVDPPRPPNGHATALSHNELFRGASAPKSQL